MNGAIDHISVCVCTYKRPELLRRLLNELRDQETAGLFTFSIVVVDNDAQRSSESVVGAFRVETTIPITYYVESQQGIALARNKAVESATGEYIAFIDDDEFPISRWLLTLFTVCNDHSVDGVLGPVKPYYDVKPPKWVLDGNFHHRATYPTGLVIDWRKGRTGNTFLRQRVFAACGKQPFDPKFRTGEDQEFFYRMIKKGFVFIWCNEAIAYEVVPPIRWQRKFMLRRALLRGALEPHTPTFGARDIVKSLIAVPAYTAVLPVSVLLGQGRSMRLLISLCDHLGKLLAVVGINPIKESYITE
jgi:glycosyltransferase involved in cell wall biosynthesis